jgi:hypothetical protein
MYTHIQYSILTHTGKEGEGGGKLILVNVAFITLLERKFLGYSQLRKGPNKIELGGFYSRGNNSQLSWVEKTNMTA